MKVLTTRSLGPPCWMVALLCCALATSARGAILYDGFDYAPGDLAGNAGGIGWATGTTQGVGAWGVFINDDVIGSATVEPGSLPFSDFPTSGNRLNLSIVATEQTDFTSSRFVRPFRQVNVNVTSGDLWQSFLWRRVDDTFNGDGDGLQEEIRVNFHSPTGQPGKFRVRPKRQNLDGFQVRYDAHLDTVENPLINNGDIYLFIVRFTNLGTNDGSGTATMWILSEDDYDAINAGGTLSTNRTGFTHVGAGTLNALTLQPGMDYRILHEYRDLASFNQDPFITEWDELRWGTSIGDVVPGWTGAQIPEPGTVLLAGLAGLLLMAFGRRQR